MTKAYQINTNNICVYGHTFIVKLPFKKTVSFKMLIQKRVKVSVKLR